MSAGDASKLRRAEVVIETTDILVREDIFANNCDESEHLMRHTNDHMNAPTRILEAIRRLTESRPFGRISMSEIANEAGCSKKTLYQLFPSREDVVLAAIEEVLVTLRDRLDEVVQVPTDSTSRLEAYLALVAARSSRFRPDLLRDIHRNYPRVWAKVQTVRKEILGEIETMLRNGRLNGEFRDVHPAVVTGLFAGGLWSVLDKESLMESPLSEQEAISQFVSIVVRGLRNPGRESSR